MTRFYEKHKIIFRTKNYICKYLYIYLMLKINVIRKGIMYLKHLILTYVS